MRRYARSKLPAKAEKGLRDFQRLADHKQASGTLDAEEEWSAHRKSQTLKAVSATLRRMAGKRERCMYCCDSHGSDIEHFAPKTPFPERMFQWANFLLCCTECGRHKGSKFPVDKNKKPLLVDPASEEPWRFLDFDPHTGNIVARFDLALNDWSPKGQRTVDLLHLDQREALAAGYLRTWSRLAAEMESSLAEPSAKKLLGRLQAVDDHGLLGWCFLGTGQSVLPFSRLREDRPTFWNECVKLVEQQPG